MASHLRNPDQVSHRFTCSPT